MELPRRCGDDVFLPDGSLRSVITRLRQRRAAHGLRFGLVYAYDPRTHMLPYWYADTRMAPCSVRTLADVLHAAGFEHLRIVLQQWTPNFRPSLAELDGQPLDVLLVSSMQVHAAAAFDLVRDAHRAGPGRPLILAGGPKAIYEPTHFFETGPKPGDGADCVVLGEAFVLLNLLETVLADWSPGQSLRSAYDRARRVGALKHVPGLVYLAPDTPPDAPVAVNTGVQRLLRDLDELPLPDAGYRVLEPRHRGTRLRPQPCPPSKVARVSPIASIIATQGCRFNCPYCPIPAANQRTWRHKSAARFAAEIKHLYENFGIRSFFGTDDNFFNNRTTVTELMQALAQTTSGGVPLRRLIKFYTEATQLDVYKNRDLLPLCRKGGLRGLWFGIEDITGELVKKGQDAGNTAKLFALMHKLGIEPHVMMIHSDAQPLRSRNGDLAGLLDQARYVFAKGAATYQCTYLGPAIGTRDLEPALASGAVFRRVGRRDVPDAYQDGNHVVASCHPEPWRQQLNLLRAYCEFYNPLNVLRTLLCVRRNSVSFKRVLLQLVGHIGLALTIPKGLSWAWQLKRGPIEVWDSVPAARIPMIDAHSGQPMQWAVRLGPVAGRPRALPTAEVLPGGASEPGLLQSSSPSLRSISAPTARSLPSRPS
jgi:radical SAM superfamily enzyme YgiQ (UPF0313 family)